MHFIHTDTCHTASIHTHIHILHLANFSVIYLILLIHTDTNRYSQNTYRYMSYCAHTYSYAHFTLSQFSSSASRRPGAWQELTGSDGRADSDNRAVTASAVAASRAGKFTTWKSRKDGLSAAGPGQTVSRRETVNATINPQNPCDVSILFDQEKAT